MERINNSRPLIEELAERVSLDIKNHIEYELTIDEYFRLRNNEYNKLVCGGEVVDTDDNHDDFDTYLGRLLNVNWG